MNFQGMRINPRRFDKSQIKFYVVLIPLALFMVIPILFIVSQAFKPIEELNRFPPTYIVESPTLMNFRQIWRLVGTTGVPAMRYLLNTVVVTVLTVVLSVFLTGISAYALSKKRFRAKGMLLKLNQAALMFVPAAVMAPRYLVIVNIGLNNNFLTHILPLLAMPVGLFLVKQFVDQVPDSLIEAARIDGAGELHVIFRIVFPLIAPALATVAILSFQAVWGSPDASNLYIIDETMKSFAFYLNSLTIGNNPLLVGVQAAAGLILFVPNLIIFIAMQSRVMNTMSHSGIK
jgi:multiple sugar transport system permease protein